MSERCNTGESNAITPVQTRILIVEDETAIREMLAMSLRHEGFEVQEAGDSRAADVSIANGLPDLMLLDWMLPGTSGVEFARRLRREDMTRELPIIMLTARGEENDKLNGFDAGADDYVPKPFSVKELIARINAVLKRSRGFAPDEILETEGLTLDPVSHRVTIGGEPVKVGPTAANFWIEFGVVMSTLKNAPLMSTSEDCASFLSPRTTTGSCRQCMALATGSPSRPRRTGAG